MNDQDDGVAETMRRHSAACRRQEAQRQRDADALLRATAEVDAIAERPAGLPARASFDELLEHLRDLTDLARAEGFELFAYELRSKCRAYARNRRVYDRDPDVKPARDLRTSD